MSGVQIEKVNDVNETPSTCNQFLDLVESESSKILKGSLEENQGIRISSNGLIFSVITAYNHHHNLILRPDDIWLAIMTQFSFFINNSEKLGKKLVNFKDVQKLEVTINGSLCSSSYETIIELMTQEMDKCLGESDLKNWILPDFTTTTDDDKMTGRIVLMGRMKKYFQYAPTVCCGIPNIFLYGSVDDWEKIYRRLEKLKEYELGKWVDMLRPILKEFVEAKRGNVNLLFWSKICHVASGCGTHEISGWITVFCSFDQEGRWRGEGLTPIIETICDTQKKSRRSGKPKKQKSSSMLCRFFTKKKDVTTTHAQSWLLVDETTIPSGIGQVDLCVNDNGSFYDTILVGGSIGVGVQDDKCTLKPCIGWVIALKNPQVTISEVTNDKDANKILQTSS